MGIKRIIKIYEIMSAVVTFGLIQAYFIYMNYRGEYNIHMEDLNSVVLGIMHVSPTILMVYCIDYVNNNSRQSMRYKTVFFIISIVLTVGMFKLYLVYE